MFVYFLARADSRASSMCVEGADRRQPLLLKGKLRSQLLCFGFPEWILWSGGDFRLR
jgi:hypothetical protein